MRARVRACVRCVEVPGAPATAAAGRCDLKQSVSHDAQGVFRVVNPGRAQRVAFYHVGVCVCLRVSVARTSAPQTS
eukprot:8310097-Lingulodinium_polyedra.AAC.1